MRFDGFYMILLGKKKHEKHLRSWNWKNGQWNPEVQRKCFRICTIFARQQSDHVVWSLQDARRRQFWALVGWSNSPRGVGSQTWQGLLSVPGSQGWREGPYCRAAETFLFAMTVHQCFHIIVCISVYSVDIYMHTSPSSNRSTTRLTSRIECEAVSTSRVEFVDL